MLYIGFTNHYFTLWNVRVENRREPSGIEWELIHYRYMQNLSMDLDAARVKIMKLTDQHAEDFTLRGDNGWQYTTKRQIKGMDLFRFSFGKLTGQDMRTSTDVWQLERAMREEVSPRRKVYARRRLIELGSLIRRQWLDRRVITDNAKEWDSENPENNIYRVKLNWMPVRLAKYMDEIGSKTGHHYTNGARIVLSVREVSRKSFEVPNRYGYGGPDTITVYLVNYLTDDDKIVTYKGGSPLPISEDHGEYIQIKATIEHGSYKEQNQTSIKRPVLYAPKVKSKISKIIS